MRKFGKPLIAVATGMAASWSLQFAGMEPLYAKLAGLLVVGIVIAFFWRRSAAL